MIKLALEVLEKELNNFIVRIEHSNTADEIVSVSPLVKPDGSICTPPEKLGMSLVNIEEERVMKAQQHVAVTANGQITYLNPELKLNLYLLISANFKTYTSGLRHLSQAISFFQSRNVFTPDNTPKLPKNIHKLIAELHTMSFEQQNHLWGAMGAKYLPSVMYKVRMLVVQEDLVYEEQPPLKSAQFAARNL